MNKHLLIALFFSCNISIASEEVAQAEAAIETVITQEEATAEEIATSNQDLLNTEIAEEQTIITEAADTETVQTQNLDVDAINVEASDTEKENSAISEITPSSLIFDFVMELEKLTEDWFELITFANTLQSRSMQSNEENNISDAFNLAQAIYNHATSNQNKAHGFLSASLSLTDNSEIDSPIESSASNYIAIRLAFTHKNDLNSDLWSTLQKLALSAQQKLQEAETVLAETEAQENPIAIISNTVETILALAKEDAHESISSKLIVTTAINNTVE